MAHMSEVCLGKRGKILDRAEEASVVCTMAVVLGKYWNAQVLWRSWNPTTGVIRSCFP